MKTQKAGLSFDEATCRVNSLDLSRISALVKQNKEWDDDRILDAETWYRRFLILQAMMPNANILTTQDVDDYWHAHILATKDYFDACNTIFGGYFHHDPVVLEECESLDVYGKAFKSTLLLFEKYFGETPPSEHISAISDSALSKAQMICYGDPLAITAAQMICFGDPLAVHTAA